MEILPDEAYYWMYSNHMDWGYLDHPPMVALWIAATKWIPGELGVRLFMIGSNLIFIRLLEDLVRPKDLKLFYLILGSMVFIHFGFLAVPDVPLVVFSVVFLIAFRRYLNNGSFLNVLFVSVSIALMLYSKYQGLILVLLAVVSQFNLLRKRSFYLVLLFSILLFLPHLIWQYVNDWPSHYFHLHERSPEEYSIQNTIFYPFEQILAFGPVIGIFLLVAGWKFKPQSAFEKTLKFVVFGMFLFLLIMTFKGPVELNWSVISIAALVYISYHGLQNTKRLRSVTKVFCWVSVIVLLSARIILITGLLPETDLFKRARSGEIWANAVCEAAGNKTVVFQNSYQQASLYAFYSGNNAHSVNNPSKRMNQYDLWDLPEDDVKAGLMDYSDWSLPRMNSFENPNGGAFYLRPNSQFVNLSQVQFKPESWVNVAAPGEKLNMDLHLDKESRCGLAELKDKPEFILYLNRHKELVWKKKIEVDIKKVISTGSVPIIVELPDRKGKYSLRISLKQRMQFAWYNSKRIYVKVD